MLKSSAIVSRDGAIIVDARGDMNVKQATRRVAVHRFRSGQFLGSAGSSSEDHVTLVLLATSEEVKVGVAYQVRVNRLVRLWLDVWLVMFIDFCESFAFLPFKVIV